MHKLYRYSVGTYQGFARMSVEVGGDARGGSSITRRTSVNIFSRPGN